MEVIETDLQSLPVILVVDDSRMIRVAVTKILSDDYEIIQAADGEIAWTLLLENHHIQLVFCDVNMPNLDGYGLLERMRQSEESPLQSLPVIIITSDDDDDGTKQRVLEKGANDFITKPFNSIELQTRAKSYIQLKKTTEKLEHTSQKLQQEATVDELTGLGSLRYFEIVLNETFSQINRHGGFCVLMNMEIDGFNEIFIQYGKNTANRVIATIGKKLSANIRGEDKAARIGLSEFSLLLVSTDISGAGIFAKRIQKEMSSLQVSSSDNKMIRITTSIGLYEAVIDSNTRFDSLLQHVKKCLISARENGGNKIISKTEIPELHDTTNENGAQRVSVESNSELTLIKALELLQNGESKLIQQSKSKLLLLLLPLLKLIISDNVMLKKLIDLLNKKSA